MPKSVFFDLQASSMYVKDILVSKTSEMSQNKVTEIARRWLVKFLDFLAKTSRPDKNKQYLLFVRLGNAFFAENLHIHSFCL